MICHHPSIKISQISLPQTAPINCSTFSSEATVVNILKATWPVFSNAHQYILRDCFIPPLLLVMGLRQVRLAPLAMHVGAWMYGWGGGIHDFIRGDNIIICEDCLGYTPKNKKN